MYLIQPSAHSQTNCEMGPVCTGLGSCCVLKTTKAGDSTASLSPVSVHLCPQGGGRFLLICSLNLSWFKPIVSCPPAMQCCEEPGSDFSVAPPTAGTEPAIWCPWGCPLSLVPQPLLTELVLQPPDILVAIGWTPVDHGLPCFGFGPQLDTAFDTWSNKCYVEGGNHFSSSTSCPSVDKSVYLHLDFCYVDSSVHVVADGFGSVW